MHAANSPCRRASIYEGSKSKARKSRLSILKNNEMGISNPFITSDHHHHGGATGENAKNSIGGGPRKSSMNPRVSSSMGGFLSPNSKIKELKKMKRRLNSKHN